MLFIFVVTYHWSIVSASIFDPRYLVTDLLSHCRSVRRYLHLLMTMYVQVGTYADVVVADAIVKGIKGFDLDTARDAMLKDVSL